MKLYTPASLCLHGLCLLFEKISTKVFIGDVLSGSSDIPHFLYNDLDVVLSRIMYVQNHEPSSWDLSLKFNRFCG